MVSVEKSATTIRAIYPSLLPVAQRVALLLTDIVRLMKESKKADLYLVVYVLYMDFIWEIIVIRERLRFGLPLRWDLRYQRLPSMPVKPQYSPFRIQSFKLQASNCKGVRVGYKTTLHLKLPGI